MKDYGLVSIITPVYNSELFISATIDSIIAQTYKNWELLITDDCSNDNTLKIVKDYAERDNRIKLFKLDSNSGAGMARNHSILNAQGRYIAFCDSDDRWVPEKLEKQLAYMDSNEYAFTFSSYYVCDEGGKQIRTMKCSSYIDFKSLLKDNSIGCLTAIYDTYKLGKVLMPKLRKRQDWGLWLLLVQKCGKAIGYEEPLAYYRQRKASISSNKFGLVKYNVAVYRDVLNYSPAKSWSMFLFKFLPTYIKKKM